MLVLLLAVVKIVGKRADPELIKLNNRTFDAFSDLRTSIDQQTESNRDQSRILGDLINAVKTHNDNTALQFRELGATYQAISAQTIQALNAVVAKAQGEHAGIQTTLDSLLNDQIINTDATLQTRSLATEIKDKLPMLTTSEQVQLIIERLDRLQIAIDALRGDVVARIDPLEKEIGVLKTDVGDLRQTVDRETAATTPDVPVVETPFIDKPSTDIQ
jgi:hypothetical protein